MLDKYFKASCSFLQEVSFLAYTILDYIVSLQKINLLNA